MVFEWTARAGAPRICTVGHATVDHCFDIQAFPGHPTKTPASGYRLISGGMAANAAIAATRLGARVRLHAPVGSDEAGDYLLRHLQSCGVACDQLQQVPGANSSISAVVIDAHGERQIFNHRGEALARAAPLNVAALVGCDVLMVDPRWMSGALVALQWARDAGVLSVLDGDLSPQADLQALTRLADWAVFSESGLAAFAPGLTREQALQAALDAGAQVAVVTQGARGACWLRKTPAVANAARGITQCMTAFEVRAIDTNGAGDVFHAALVVALSRGQTDHEALRFASAAAAIKCQRNGGVAHGPDTPEVEAFLALQRV